MSHSSQFFFVQTQTEKQSSLWRRTFGVSEEGAATWLHLDTCISDTDTGIFGF